MSPLLLLVQQEQRQCLPARRTTIQAPQFTHTGEVRALPSGPWLQLVWLLYQSTSTLDARSEWTRVNGNTSFEHRWLGFCSVRTSRSRPNLGNEKGGL